MIFRMLKVHKMARDAKENPGKFATDEASNLFVSMLLMPIISAVLLIGLLFILGFTTWLGGPFAFFKFLFFFSVIGITTFFFILRKAYLAMKRAASSSVNKTIKVESKVVEENESR